jgi:hypothetical protein
MKTEPGLTGKRNCRESRYPAPAPVEPVPIPALTLVFVFICFLLRIEFGCRRKQADRPRFREWKGSHDPLLPHPATAAVIL